MQKHSCSVFILSIFIILLISSCSVYKNLNKNKTLYYSANHQKLLATLTSYQINGSFVYFSKAKRFYAHFNWKYINNDINILILSDVFGKNQISIIIQPNIIQLINNQGKHYISQNSEIIIKKLIGVSIPISKLRLWIIGLLTDANNYSIDDRGYLHQARYGCNKDNWIVTYHNYYDNIIPALPSNLELCQNDKFIKIKVDHWNL